MSESVCLIREQGSGEPRVSRSPLIEQPSSALEIRAVHRTAYPFITNCENYS